MSPHTQEDNLFADGLRLIEDINAKNWLAVAQDAIDAQQHALDAYKGFHTTKAGCGPDDDAKLAKLECDLKAACDKCCSERWPIKAGAAEAISPADVISIVTFVLTWIQKIRALRGS